VRATSLFVDSEWSHSVPKKQEGALLKKINWWARPCGHNARDSVLSLEATAEKLGVCLFISTFVHMKPDGE